MRPCPSIEMLRQLLDGPPSSVELQAVEAHVESCAFCQETLADLGQDLQVAMEPLVKSPGQLGHEDDPPANFLRRLEDSNPFLAEGGGHASQDETEPAPICFPGPPTAKGVLGQLGTYHVKKELGRGRFGVVFQAYDDKLRRVVALKVLRPELAASAKYRARFEREAWAAADIRDEHVVTVFDASTAPDCLLPYIAMEWIDGESLRDRLVKTGPLEPRVAAEIVGQVTRGVAAAHEQGLVHGDVKPSNILLERRKGRAKIVDFGLARAIEATDEPGLFLGRIVGTPAYMSPEQLASPGQAGQPGDVYSLGVVLYEMLTGERPFGGVGSMLLRQVLREEPRPPRKLNHRIPRDLETICLKCLHKEPHKRYANAEALAEDLGRFLDGEPIHARPVRVWERGVKWVWRHPAVAALVSVSVAAGTALLIMGLVFNTQLQMALRDAERERQDARNTNFQAQVRLTRVNIANGLQHLERGDLRGALTLFAEAVQTDPEDGQRVEANRVRFGAVLRQFPRLIQVLEHDGRVNCTGFSADGRWALTASADDTARLWDAATGQPLTRQPLQHDGAVWYATFSPDGRCVLTASADKTACIWDAATGERLLPPLRHQARVYHAVFSPSGCQVVTASDDKTAQVWDAVTGDILTPPLNHQARVYHASFSLDGRYVVTASEDNTARVWDATTGRPIGQPFKHNAWVYQASFSPDGRHVLTACADGTAQIWAVAEGQLRPTIFRHIRAVMSATFSPEGHRVLTASQDRTARVWDAATGQPLTPPLTHDGEVRWASFSPDGHCVVTASQDQTARVWHATTGEPLTPPLKHDHEVRHATFSPDGCRLLTAGADGTARLWDLTASQPFTPLLRPDHRVCFTSFSADGRLLTASADNTVQLWDLDTGQPLSTSLRHDVGLYHAAFSRDGKRLLTIGRDKAVRVWDLATGRALAEPLQHTTLPNHASFSPDGRRIFTATPDQTARIWEVTENRAHALSLAHGVWVFTALFSPDGRRLLTVSHDGMVQLWDTDTGHPCSLTLPPNYRAWRAAFSPDGRYLLLGTRDNTAQVWDVAMGRPVTLSLRHDGQVEAVAFSPDGRRVLTASTDRTARLWDATTGHPLTAPLRHDHPVLRAMFSPEGRRVLTVSADGWVRVWDAGTGQPLTLPFKYDASLNGAAFSPDGRRVLATSEGGQAWVWDVSADDRPGDDLILLAQLLCGHQLDEAGHFVPVDPAQRRQAWQTLRARYPGAFAPPSAEEVLAWHRSQAAECEFRREWFAARWHLDRLLAAAPAQGLLYARRARASAELGEWRQAAADSAQAVPTQPDDSKLWYEHACLHLQIGDTDGYRQACARLLERFGQTKDPLTALFVTRACVLAPRAVADPMRLVHLMEKAIAYDPHNTHHLHVLGAALHRAGELGDAVKWLHKAQTGKEDAVSDWLLLAMTHYRLGHAAEAGSWLDKAAQSLDQSSREKSRNPGTRLAWHEWLEIQLLYDEAKALFAAPFRSPGRPASGSK